MLGDRLRELRLHAGMTLRELALAADISASMLSQIENGTTDPSMNTLRKIAKVFGGSMSTLFTDPDAPRVHVSRPGHRSLLSAPAGQIVYERLTPGRGELEVLRADLAPGDASASEAWSHPSTESAFVLTGSIVVEIDNDSYPVDAGEAITFDSRLAHRYVNQSDEHASMIVSITPPNP